MPQQTTASWPRWSGHTQYLKPQASGLPPSFPVSRGSMDLYLYKQKGRPRGLASTKPKLRRGRFSRKPRLGGVLVSIVLCLRRLVPYDPSGDASQPMDEEDLLIDPRPYAAFKSSSKSDSNGSPMVAIRGGKPNGHSFLWRGITNFPVTALLILALLLFIFYPVFTFYRNQARNKAIDINIRINATGMCQPFPSFSFPPSPSFYSHKSNPRPFPDSRTHRL